MNLSNSKIKCSSYFSVSFLTYAFYENDVFWWILYYYHIVLINFIIYYMICFIKFKCYNCIVLYFSKRIKRIIKKLFETQPTNSIHKWTSRFASVLTMKVWAGRWTQSIEVWTGWITDYVKFGPTHPVLTGIEWSVLFNFILDHHFRTFFLIE